MNLRRRGSALLLTIFFVILLYALASSYYALIPVELRNAQRAQDDAEAFYVADSGVTDAISQMEYQLHILSYDFEHLDSPNNSFWTRRDGVAAIREPEPNLQTTGFLNQREARQLVAVKTWSAPVSARMSYEVILERWDCRGEGETVPSNYHITASAIFDRGTPQRRVRRQVEAWATQKNFSGYGWWQTPFSGSDLVLDPSRFKIDGPYHSNGKIIMNPVDWNTPADWSAYGDYYAGKTSMFLSRVTLVTPVLASQQLGYKEGFDWRNLSMDQRPYTSAGTEIPERYQRLVDGGRARIATVSSIPLPRGSDRLGEAALGSSIPENGLASNASTSTFGATGAPNIYSSSSTAINLHVSRETNGTMAAGLVLQGDVDSIELKAPEVADGNGSAEDNHASGMGKNSEMIVTQGNRNATITSVYESFTIPAGAYIYPSTTATTSSKLLNFSDGDGIGFTVVRDGSSNRYRVYPGTGNGAIFINGNVNSLSGTNRGRKTIATSIDSGTQTGKDKEIRVTSDLLRADTPVVTNAQGKTVLTKPPGIRDQLGLVTYAVRLPKKLANNRLTTPDKPLLLYAAIFTGRQDDPRRNSDLTTAQTRGGGMGTLDYVNADKNHFRLVGSLTEGLRQTKGQVGTSGFSYEMLYDDHLSRTSPPYFPGTSGMRLLTWTELPVRQQ